MSSSPGGRYQYSPAFRVLLDTSQQGFLPNASVAVISQGAMDPLDPYRWDNPTGPPVGGRTYHVYASPDGTGRWMVGPQTLFVSVPSASRAVQFDFTYSRELNGFRRVHWIWGENAFTGLIGRTDGLSFVDLGRDDLKHQQPLPGTETTEPPFGDNPLPFDVLLSPYTVSIGPSPFYDQQGVSRYPTQVMQQPYVRGVDYRDQSDEPDRVNQNLQIRVRERGLRREVSLEFDVWFGSSAHRDLETVYAARLARPTLKTFFCLNYDASHPDWFEAQVVGSLPRRPAHGTNDRIRIQWTVLDYETMRQVPGVLGIDGRGLS